MSIDFASVRAITIPEGAVKMITAPDGTVLWKMGYTWKKYNVVTNTTYSETLGDEERVFRRSYGGSIQLTCHSNYTFSSSDGTYTFSGTTRATTRTYRTGNYQRNYPYITYDNVNYLYASLTVQGDNNTYTFMGQKMGATANTTYSCGTYIEDVAAIEADAYPDNGKHTDGYWYVKQS